LARHESIRPEARQEPLALPELLDLLSADPGLGDGERNQAIACYLSGSEGWREAVKQLGGAFAPEVSGLRERKAD
jgi:hypothetical protein